MVQSVVKTMEERFRAKQQAWSVKIAEPFEVEVDKDRFRQILLNLLSNASNYTPPGGRITVEVEKRDESWLCKVSDTGIGIPKEDLPRVFERFYRVDKARARDSGGTGLGLAIVKHLVEAHQGEIEVSSQIGQGTTFTLSFPMTKKDRNA
jgi:two-component system, OmpR family, phosphate regulon sensor histidine kinase PhoR